MGYVSEQRIRSSFGFERGDLAPTERLTIWLPLAPSTAGPLARANTFLVSDPAREQVTQSLVESTVRSFALFGALDYRFDERWALRAEARATREYLDVAGTANSPRNFSDATPRISLQYEARSGALLYVSAAKGSRSGGINAAPGLDPGEQTFAPEYNWTYEAGAKYEQSRWRADATFYYIDWRNTQLLGFPQTPGIGTLITRNTEGVRTAGIELSLAAQLHERLALEAAYSLADSSFAAGSDDAGSATFCGLKGSNVTSSFCEVGPPRSGGGSSYVPYVDGNALQRAPEHQAAVKLTGDLTPAAANGWRLDAVIDASYQDDVYDRAIGGARFGERTLLAARVKWLRGPWLLELWGTNLTDELYVRSVASRGAAFYPVSPRPLDLVYADGRRVGLSVRYAL
jgi:outer membrane receptor protein involved in Fe transport